ncbi:MAG: peptidyl-prolyl cis-trans isomerase [Candidatus Sumerlaeia bacterium]|nr:peptidyl-prolyl cis-trans isomerase [Candidatus Sumerlaeia bacterium]
MLKQLRSQKVMRRVLRITLILIIPSFVFYYGWSSSRRSEQQRENTIATIKHTKFSRAQEITPEDLIEAEDRLTEQFAGFARLLGVPQRFFLNPRIREAIPNLDKIMDAIHFYLLLHFANQQGIITDQEEIVTRFRSLWPQNTAAYIRQYMNARRINNEQYLIWREQQDTNVSKSKYMFYAEARASLFELWQQFLITDEKIKIDYVKIPLAELKDSVEVTDEALARYYEEHKEKYRIPEQYIFSYIKQTIEDFNTTITVTSEEIQKYYEENIDRYKIPKRVKARHILVKVPPEAEPNTVDQLRQKAEDLYKRARQGESFEALANEFSDEYVTDEETTVTKNGGLMGWISSYSKRIYGEELVNKVLAIEQPGEITPPIRTDRGFEIVKAEEIIPERTQSLDEVKSSIQSLLFTQHCKDFIAQKASELSVDLYKYTNLSALAKQLQKEEALTSPVKAGEYFLPEIGNLMSFKAAINDMIQTKEIEIFPLPNYLVLMQIKEIIPSHIPELEAIRNEVTEDYKYERAKEMGKQIAEKIKQSVTDSGTTITAVAELQQFPLKSSDYFTRENLPPELGQIPNFSRFTLETKPGEIMLSESMGPGNKTESYIVWVMKDKKPPSLEEFKKAIPRLERELIQIKRMTILNEYLADAVKKVKVHINPRFMNP